MADFNYLEIFMYLVLYLLCICFVGVIIYGIKKYKREKRGGCIFVTVIVGLFLMFLIDQLAVVSLYFSSVNSFTKQEYERAKLFANSAAILSIFPSQKSALYGELGQIYMTNGEGEKAIKSFEKAYKINGSYVPSKNFATSSIWPVFAGMLYTASGNYEEVYKIANETKVYRLGLVAAVSAKDYKKAIGYSNLDIANLKNSSDYAKRAYIYKKLKKEKYAQDNMKMAIALCRGDKKCMETQYNILKDSYWTDFQAKQREKFGLGK